MWWGVEVYELLLDTAECICYVIRGGSDTLAFPRDYPELVGGRMEVVEGVGCGGIWCWAGIKMAECDYGEETWAVVLRECSI